MTLGKREITKEVYDRAIENHGYIASQDMSDVFSISELCGYGVYGAVAVKEGDKYFCKFKLGSSCD